MQKSFKFLALSFFVFFLGINFAHASESFGLMSDIHAGKAKKITTTRNKVKLYPQKAFKTFVSSLNALERKGINNVIVLGDLFEKKTDSAYFSKLKREAAKHNLHTIWVLGNHDFRAPETTNLTKYFYEDLDDYRIVVLNTNEMDNLNSSGAIGEEQYSWLEDAVKTDKKVILAGHHPMFAFKGTTVLSNFQRLKEIIDSNSNVIAYLSGHWHESITYLENEKEYFVTPALTDKGYSIWTPREEQDSSSSPY